MANDHGEQIRIVQETVAGKEITFAHVMGGSGSCHLSEIGSEPSAGLSFFCNWNYEYDTSGISSDRI